MTGFMSTLPHIFTVLAIWLAVIVIAQLVKIGVFKSINTVQNDDETKKQTDERKSVVQKAIKLVNISSTVLAAIVILLVVLFLSNPYERTYEGIKTVTPAQVDESYKPPTREEIDQSNKEAVEEEHLAKEEEAEKDNTKAMKDATDLFRKAVEEADKNDNQ